MAKPRNHILFYGGARVLYRFTLYCNGSPWVRFFHVMQTDPPPLLQARCNTPRRMTALGAAPSWCDCCPHGATAAFCKHRRSLAPLPMAAAELTFSG